MENHTAKNFALQLGSLASLYLSLSFLVVLLFGIINILYPDATNDYWMVEQAHSNVRLGIAIVVVFFPTYLVLTRMVNSARRTQNNGVYLALTKWLIYLSLLVGGAVLLGDLVAVIMSFLEGELTQRFLLKAGALFLIVGAAFHYYILDARGHWVKEESKSIMFAIGASLVVLASVAFGFTHIDTPSAVREQKLDATQISDLQQLQWRIQDHAVTNGTLPESLEQLTGGTLPVAPENRPAYVYKITGDGFELCATFAQPSTESENYMYQSGVMIEEKMMIKNPDNWQHEAGVSCFKRVINPSTQTNQ